MKLRIDAEVNSESTAVEAIIRKAKYRFTGFWVEKDFRVSTTLYIVQRVRSNIQIRIEVEINGPTQTRPVRFFQRLIEEKFLGMLSRMGAIEGLTIQARATSTPLKGGTDA